MSLFTVNTDKKILMPLGGTKLSEQQLTERYDLQEWLVSHPQALGEELLIIQKEFSGFDGTGERLDLLALDTQGRLVLIENKRDESGRDAVWQAIKYASYVAPFTVDDIEDVFAKYLLKYKPKYIELDDNAYDLDQVKHTAKLIIKKFLEENQEIGTEITTLNLGKSQRIILVAGEFRREVTSTALWLIERGIDVKCVKVSPYILHEQLLVQIQQIIPVPEASEYMVRLNRKDAEEVSVKIKRADKTDIRYQYWELLLKYFSKFNNSLYNNISPKSDHWLNTGSGISGCVYTLLFLQKELRVEFAMGRSNAEENKLLFDFFNHHKQQIETSFGQPLEWLRLDDKKSSRIQLSIAVDGYDHKSWEQYIKWHLQYIENLEKALKPLIGEAYKALNRAY
ncbi:DUF4268 domain-containing protein [Acinetobacter populi]|uniref:Uncharacterized protein n=1 Tax=Acinetobacter populi TaxID=1582270 RepID=A0A1Z9Z018_9GAMM|nr:DUF4268 domain-containing protein [Acinetobacter populi]OUY07806.1 hypothetical protein CAP51_08775 [Acinetobacter populi]